MEEKGRGTFLPYDSVLFNVISVFLPESALSDTLVNTGLKHVQKSGSDDLGLPEERGALMPWEGRSTASLLPSSLRSPAPYLLRTLLLLQPPPGLDLRSWLQFKLSHSISLHREVVNSQG